MGKFLPNINLLVEHLQVCLSYAARDLKGRTNSRRYVLVHNLHGNHSTSPVSSEYLPEPACPQLLVFVYDNLKRGNDMVVWDSLQWPGAPLYGM